VVLLIGDVALAHDIGGLLAAKRLQLALTVVLLDNGGGAIFDFLPVARAPLAVADDVYTHHIATPTGLEPHAVAALFGLAHEPVDSLPSLRAALERSLARTGSSLIVVPSERPANVRVHEEAWRAAAGALSR
jgi:2-succinyl-5-enolpyruvyl-6-hydroxy-3-cyclohexene-1-carboxylate synthase